MSHLLLVKGKICSVQIDERIVAQLRLDASEQTVEVVLRSQISDDDTAQVYRIALSHVVRYAVNRRDSSGSRVAQTHRLISVDASHRILRDGYVPEEFRSLDHQTLRDRLADYGVEITQSRVNSLHDALKAAVEDIPVRVTFSLGATNVDRNTRTVTFTVDDQQFVIWKRLHYAGNDSDLYIVPAYHPVRTNYLHTAYLVNGDTNGVVGSRVVCSLQPPFESRRIHCQAQNYWEVNHPYYAAGHTIEASISQTLALSAKGIQEIRRFVLAMLQYDHLHVSVSGGFRSPKPYPAQIAINADIRIGTWDNRPRGSEAHCYWAYETLAQEGALGRAYVPEWFTQEGWVAGYEQLLHRS